MDDIIKIKKPKNWYVITLIVLCVILLLACGYFVWDKYFNKTSDNTTTETTQTATTTTTEEATTANTTATNETADWQTYTNTVDNYSIKYPTKFEKSATDNGASFFNKGSNKMNWIISMGKDDLTEVREVQINGVSQKARSVTFEQFVSNDLPGQGTDKVESVKKITVTSGIVYEVSYSGQAMNGSPITSYYAYYDLGNNQYLMFILNGTENLKTFETMLTTFVKNSSTTADLLKAATSITTNFTKDTNDYHGTLVLTGYLTTAEVSADPYDETSTAKKTYASFVYTSSSTNLIDQYLNENSGNSFVGNKSIGLGCYDSTTKTIESVNMADAGSATNIISGSNLTTLLASNANNQVKLALTKPVLTGGSGAPVCYSHFRDFELVK